MSKKNIKTGIDAILGASPEPEKKKAVVSETEIRTTFISDIILLEKFKSIAYWDRILIKDVFHAAMLDAVSKYEKKNGEIKPMPKK